MAAHDLDGAGATSSHTQERVEHVLDTEGNDRLVIYIALGGHGTYFVADEVIDVPVFGSRMGTQEQYDSDTVNGAYDVTAAAGREVKRVGVEFLPLDQEPYFDKWQGRWGYLRPNDLYHNKNGPPGPLLRYLHDSKKNRVVVKDDPKLVHNACRKTNQKAKMHIP